MLTEIDDQSFLDGIPDALMIINIADHKIIAVSKMLLDQLNLTEKQVIGKTCFEITHNRSIPCSGSNDICPIHELLKTDKPVMVEHTHFDKDGNPFYVAVSASPIPNKEGKITKIIHLARDITERKKCEAALVNEHNILSALLDNIPDAVYLKDDNFNYAKANKAYAERLGLENANSIVGKNAFDFFSKKDAEIIYDEDREIKRSGKPIIDRVKTINLPNRTIATSTTKAPIKNETGDVIGVIGISRDITEREEITQRLQISEKRFREMLDNMLEGCQLIGHDWRYLYVNDAAAIQGRIQKEKMLGKTMMEVYPGIEKSEMFSNLKICMKNGTPKKMDNEFTFPDESKGWFELSMQAIPEGVLILSIDITESKIAQEKLRDERQMLEDVSGNMNAGLVIISKDYRIVWANKFLTNTIGNIIGKKCYSVLSNYRDTCPGCGVKEIFETGKDKVIHEQKPDFGKKLVWLEITALPIRDENGNITAVSELSVDITERKKAEETLKLAEEKYRKLFEEAMDAIFVADAETGIIIDCNRTATQLIDRPKTELIGMHQRLLHPPKNNAEEFTEPFKKHRTSKESFSIEAQVITKNGEIRDVTIKANLLEVSGRKLLQGIFRDVTEQKQVQRRLREFAYQLNGLPSSGCFLLSSHEHCFKAYADLTFHGLPNLCIVREDPERLVKEYGIKPESVRMLSSKPLKTFEALQDLQAVSLLISDFLKANRGGVVLLDGLEYLVARSGFESVYGFLQEKRFDFLESSALLIMPVNLAAFNEKEKALLYSEIKVLDTQANISATENASNTNCTVE